MIRQVARLLTFKLSREEFLTFGPSHLIFAMLATWVVGMGRWWDDPAAQTIQKLGVGSLVYVLFLAFVIWILAMPFKPLEWSYPRVLTFVGLTAPPAILYAIPVERFLSMEIAVQLNLWFLLIVAAWRVVLLVFFLHRYAQLAKWVTAVTVLMPMSLTVMALTMLNLSRGVVAIMGGLRDPGADDMANFIVTALGFLAYTLVIPLVIGYVVAIVIARRRKGPEDPAEVVPIAASSESEASRVRDAP